MARSDSRQYQSQLSIMVSISNNGWYNYYVREWLWWALHMVCITNIESVPELYKMDTITNRQLCSSIELLIAMKKQGPWGAIAWKVNK